MNTISLVHRFMFVLLLVGASLATVSMLAPRGQAWSNGGYSDDPAVPDYGTHDWIAQHALDWLPAQEKQYIVDNLVAYLYGTELPDNGAVADGIGDTINHHIYYNSGGALTDDAAASRALTEYNDTLTYIEAHNYANASKNAGIMTHYIADMAVFGHVMGVSTDWGEEEHDSDYETYVNDYTSTYVTEFNAFLSFDGNLDTISAYEAARKLAYDTTFDSNGDLTCVWMDQNYNWSNPTFRNRAGESLNLAVNFVTDVLHTLYLEANMPEEFYLNVPHYFQAKSYTCGPAALEMVFDYYGAYVPEAEIADVARTAPPGGTYAIDMIRAAQFSDLSMSVGNEMPGSINGYTARKLGYAALEHRSMTMDELKFSISLGYPIIVLTTWHFRVAVGYSPMHMTFQDSAYGKMYNMTYATFDTDWDYSHHWALLVTLWKVNLTAPTDKPVGSPFNVTATVTHPSPPPFSSSQYPTSESKATITLPSGMSFATGQTAQKTLNDGNLTPGQTTSQNWVVQTNAAGTYAISVEAEGKVTGFTPYSYTDRIGGSNQTTINSVWADPTPPATSHDYVDVWHSTDFSIALTATDAVSGVNETYYRVNNNPTQTVTADGQPLITTESAFNTLEYWSIDNAGNEEIHHTLTNIKLDKTAPTGSIVINSGDTYTNATTVTLSLTATDATSGVREVRYTTDGIWDTEPWEIPSTTRTWTITPAEGVKTIYYVIRDNADQLSETFTDTMILDTTPPTTSHDYVDVWHPTDFRIILAATDMISGVRETYYRINNGPTQTVTADDQPLITTESAFNTLEYWSIDNTGNDETHHILSNIKLDKTGPAGSIIINSGDRYTNATTVTLSSTATDATSGVHQVRYTTDGIWDTERWETPAASRTWTLTPTEGVKTIYYLIRDNADQMSETYMATIILDTTPPTLAITSPKQNVETKSSTITIAWISSDQTSGIYHYRLRLDGVQWIDKQMDTTHTYTDLQDGTHTITIAATDNTGNTRQATLEFTVNTSPLLGPGYIEEGVITAVIVVAALATIVYLVRRKRKG